MQYEGTAGVDELAGCRFSSIFFQTGLAIKPNGIIKIVLEKGLSMNKKQLSIFAALVGVFVFAYFMNFASPKIQNAIMEAFYMLQWYVRYHTLACVVPAMFIAGAIAAFFSKEAVLRHLGPKANKVEAYGVASTSGTVLAVCSCSVLPMFAGIYRVGAGLGPASAFLYSGPAINVMAIFLTARVLGFDLGMARIIGSIVFAVVIGLTMAFLFRKDEEDRTAVAMQLPDPPPAKRSVWQTALFFVCMISLLVFSDWANPSQTIIEKTDGTHLHATVLIRTAETYRVQLEEPLGDLKKGAKVMLNISDIRLGGRPYAGQLQMGRLGVSPSLVLRWRILPDRYWSWRGSGSTERNWPNGWTIRGISPSRSYRFFSAACW